MKKTMMTTASILFMLAFLLLHNFVTNSWLDSVNESKIYYPVFAGAIQYLLAALLFKAIFRPEKLLFSGLHLFLFEIAFNTVVAGCISVIDHSNIFFPQFFPFHFVVDGCVVWAVLGNLKSNKMRVALAALGFALSVIAECLLPYHFLTAMQTVADNSFKKLPPLRYRFTDSGTIQIPNATKEYFIVFFSYNECPTCVFMTPFVEDLCRKFSSEKIAVAKINPINTLAEVRTTENGNGCLKTLIPEDTAAFNTLVKNNVDLMPLLVVIDNSGQILYLHGSYMARVKDLLLTDIEKIIAKNMDIETTKK